MVVWTFLVYFVYVPLWKDKTSRVTLKWTSPYTFYPNWKSNNKEYKSNARAECADFYEYSARTWDVYITWNTTDCHASLLLTLQRERPEKMSSTEATGKNCHGWAARDDSGFLSPYEFDRRAVGSEDVSLKITHCGVCYADVLFTHNKLKHSGYPLVPGHEIVGIVTDVGGNVGKFKIGDHVGVGTYVDSCRDCEDCHGGLEMYCSKGFVTTYGGTYEDGSTSKGGYSQFIVVHERYCYKIPDKYPLAQAAPLLCAGISVYAPMIHHQMNQPGKSLGVIGLGGLGHMAVKFAKACGLNVTVFSTNISKKDDALNLLKADKFVLSSDTEQMSALSKSLDFIIDTASGEHPLDLYMSLLKTGGVLALLGFPGEELKLSPLSLLMGMRSISGSAVGGTKRTQEMLEFCAEHEIHPEIEVIPIQYANEAFERLQKNDVKYRFVIDIENSLG